MRIPFDNINIIKENVVNVNEIYDISESCHSFNKQYETSEFLAMCTYNALCNKEESIKVNVYNISEGKIRNVTILISYFDGVTIDFNAVVKSMTKEGDFTMEISYGIETNMKAEQKIKKIYTAISHELMHYNIFNSRLKNNVRIDDVPDYYDIVVDAYGKVKAGIFKKFLYAIYSTFYQEAQAIVSEVYAEVYPYNKENLIEKLKQSQGYKIFQQNLSVVEELRQSEKNQKEIEKDLKMIGIEISLNQALVKIETQSIKAIHNIINNLYFNLNRK